MRNTGPLVLAKWDPGFKQTQLFVFQILVIQREAARVQQPGFSRGKATRVEVGAAIVTPRDWETAG